MQEIRRTFIRESPSEWIEVGSLSDVKKGHLFRLLEPPNEYGDEELVCCSDSGYDVFYAFEDGTVDSDGRSSIRVAIPVRVNEKEDA